MAGLKEAFCCGETVISNNGRGGISEEKNRGVHAVDQSPWKL
jgi:hypothetical protein